MKSLEKINKLADLFELKLRRYAQAPTVSQMGTTELFFDSEDNQRAYNAAIQNPKSMVFQVLNNCYAKTQSACSFDLKISAEPGKGASWQLTVVPETIKNSVSAALDAEYRKLMKTSMADRQRMADAKSKKDQSGSGTLDVGSMDLT